MCLDDVCVCAYYIMRNAYTQARRNHAYLVHTHPRARMHMRTRLDVYYVRSRLDVSRMRSRASGNTWARLDLGVYVYMIAYLDEIVNVCGQL